MSLRPLLSAIALVLIWTESSAPLSAQLLDDRGPRLEASVVREPPAASAPGPGDAGTRRLSAMPQAGNASGQSASALPRLASVEAAFPLIDSGFASAPDTANVPLDLRIARIARSPRYRDSALLRASSAVTGLAAFPGTILLAGALYGAGEARDDDELSTLGLQLGSAATASIAAAVGVKVLVGRARPDISPDAPNDVEFGRGFRGNHYQSFPSAHTAAAFAAATVLTAELGTEGNARFWLPPTAYGLATLAGLSRIYHEQHWFTDILAGAGVGLASGVVTVQMIED